MPLSQFAEPIESVGGVFKAYRMDSNTEIPDMRLAAGLGSCNCCDFVTVSKDNQSVFLIEETNLEYTIYNFRQKYDYLEEVDKNKFFTKKFVTRTDLNFMDRCWSCVACQACRMM